MKPLLDPIAQKGYAYAFGDWLPKMLENNATALVGMEQDAQKQRKEEAAKKEALERQQKTERIANQRLLAAQRPELAGVYLQQDEEELRGLMPKYIEMMGAATNTNALDNPELYRQLQDLGMDIQLKEAKARKRYEKAYASEAELMQNPDKYENTVNDLHANVAGYGDHVAKGGNPDEYQFMGLKPKVEPYSIAEFEKLVMTDIPEKKTEKEVWGPEYTVLGQKYKDRKTEITSSIDPQEAAKRIKQLGITDKRAAKTIEYMLKSGQYVINKDGVPVYDENTHGLDLVNRKLSNKTYTGEKTFGEEKKGGGININLGGGGAANNGMGNMYNPMFGKTGNVLSRDVSIGNGQYTTDITHSEEKIRGVLPSKPRPLEDILTTDINPKPVSINGVKYNIPIFEIDHPEDREDGGYGDITVKEGIGKAFNPLNIQTDNSKETTFKKINTLNANYLALNAKKNPDGKKYVVSEIQQQPFGYITLHGKNGELHAKRQKDEDADEYQQVLADMADPNFVTASAYADVRVKYDDPDNPQNSYYKWYKVPQQYMKGFNSQNIVHNLGREQLGSYYAIPASQVAEQKTETPVQKAETNAKKSMNDIFNRNK